MPDGKQKIDCGGCGKSYDVTLGDGGSTSIVNCECGAQTTVMKSGTIPPGREADGIIGALNGVIGRIAPLIQGFRDSKMKGGDTGLGEAIHDATKEMVKLVLEEDTELRNALKRWVQENLRQNLMPQAPPESV